MQIRYTAMPGDQAHAYRTGAPDAYGHPPERQISDGHGNPCRHCLQDIPMGRGMLVFAYRPFEKTQAYAETGPVFLCADACDGYGPQTEMPPVLATRPDYLLKGYDAHHRIVYGTGAVTRAEDMAGYAARVFGNPKVAYIHVRSSRNNCYQARIDRG